MVPEKYNQWREDANFALSAEEFLQGDPNSVSDAQQRDDWSMLQNAINDEYNSLIKNDTWILCELPKG